MDDITILMLVLTIGLFLVRYVIKRSGVDFLAAIMGLCTTVLVLQDETIPEDQLLLFISPVVFMLMITFVHLMFSSKKDSY